ncbi:MAG TPA: DNA repair protein RecO [Ktedonosporobacter sp.]|nr:DNA repair protein RecO [Ktedonosporobacter sp.]
MRQQRSYSTEAIILKHINMGEADRILTLLTPYKGKMNMLAKGARRPISKKAGHLELLCYSQLHAHLGRNLDIVTQAQEIQSFVHLRSSLWHMTCGFYLAEMVDRFIEDTTPHQDVYNLLLETLRALDADASEMEQTSERGASDQARTRSQLLLRYFEMNMLSYIGYEPVFRSCAHCNAELQPVENGFNPALGGALCPNCMHLRTRTISANALKVLRLLQRSDWPQVPRFRMDPRLHAEVEAAMHTLLRFHLERDLKSWDFLEMLNGSY